MSRAQLLLLALLFEGGLGLIACGLGWALGDPLWRRMAADREALLWGVLATVPMAGSLLLLGRLPLRTFRMLARQVETLVRDVFANSGPVDWAIISLLAGVGEELLFRGFIQDRIARGFGTVPALAVASLMFGFAHPISRTYVLMASIAGCYLGCLYLVTGNLVVPIVTHATYDFLALAYLLRASAQAPPGQLKTW
ncbi:MAG: lysostaphin resistance A-like protein [Pirellulales bacterium]